MSGLHWGYVLLYAIPIVVISSQFRSRAYEDKSIDFQVALRLGFFVILFLIPLVLKSTWRSYIRFRIDNMMYVLLLYFMLTAAIAPNPFFSAFNAFSLLILSQYAQFMLRAYGPQDTVRTVAMVGFLICSISLVVYAINPDFARMKGWDGVAFGSINRLRGITGTANAIGAVAAMSTAVIAIFWQCFKVRYWRPFALVTVALCLICLAMSDSRTSMIGLVFTLYVYFLFIRFRQLGFVVSLVAAVVGLVGISLFFNEILTSLSRSGNIEEITSGTGRTMIWTVVLELWSRNPVIGYGFSAANVILPKDPRLFTVAAHAHNMYLEILFSGGLIAFAIFIVAIFYPLFQVARTRRYDFLSIYLFFLLQGLTESSPFSTVGGFSTFIFFISLHGTSSAQPSGIGRPSPVPVPGLDRRVPA